MDTKKLEDNGYVATHDDVQVIAQSVLDATALSQDCSRTYLRILIGTTQAQLGVVVRRRAKLPPLDDAERKRQIDALDEVHAAFYEVIMRVVQASPLRDVDIGKDRSAIYSSRANFARSAKSTVRAWLRSGHDLRTLTAGKATKYALQADLAARVTTHRAPSEKRILRGIDKIVTQARKADDPKAAVKLLEAAVERLVREIAEIDGNRGFDKTGVVQRSEGNTVWPAAVEKRVQEHRQPA